MEVSPGVVMTSAPWAIPGSDSRGSASTVEQAEDHTGGEAVAPSDPVEDVEGVVDPTAVPPIGAAPERPAPPVRGGRVHGPFGPGDHAHAGVTSDEIRFPFDRGVDTEQDIHIIEEIVGQLARRLLAAPLAPQARSVVDVVGDDGARASGGAHGIVGDGDGGGRQPGEDAAGVEPAHAELAEQPIPVDIAGLHRRGRRVGAVRHSDRRPDAEATLGEVQGSPVAASEIVGFLPHDVFEIDPALQHQIFEESSDLVVGDRGHVGDALPEASSERPADIVLAAALRHPEGSSGPDAPLARIEAQHDLAQGHHVVDALPAGTERQIGHRNRLAWSTAADAASVTAAQRLAASTERSTIHEPPTARTDSISRYSARLCGDTPPVGTNRTSGQTAPRARIMSGPPTTAAGNSLTTSMPSRRAAMSLGGRGDAGDDRHVPALRSPNRTLVEAGRHHEARAGVDRVLGGLGGGHRPRADDRSRDRDRCLDRSQAGGGPQRDLDHRQPAGRQCRRDRSGVVGLVEGHDRNDGHRPQRGEHVVHGRAGDPSGRRACVHSSTISRTGCCAASSTSMSMPSPGPSLG